MGHIFGPKWIRVKTPITSDGKTLVYDENNQVTYSEVDLPLSSKAIYEKQNERVAPPYRHVIVPMDETKAPDPETLTKGAGKTTKKVEKNETATDLV